MKTNRLLCILAATALAAGCGTVAPRAGSQKVNIGYGEVSREELTTSVSTVTINENDIQGYTNIFDYLRGKVPGVIITGDRRILIRGITTINASNDPLILVDGVEMRDISGLNPHDVKKVDVLKDSAASIYGNRGACGVILITTRDR